MDPRISGMGEANESSRRGRKGGRRMCEFSGEGSEGERRYELCGSEVLRKSY